MTLTIHSEENDQRQLAVSVEVDESRVQNEMRKVARRLARTLQVPGFRKGKAPYNVVVRRFGEEAIRAEAVDDMMQAIFTETMEQLDPELYAPADVEDVQLEPLVFKFVLPLAPTVELGDYRSIRKEVEEVVIGDEAVQEQLEAIQKRHQVLEPVDRPVAAGDVVTVGGKGVATAAPAEGEAAEAEGEADAAAAGGEVVFEEERIDFLMDKEEVYFGADFVDAIIGAESGADLAFTVSYPDDYEQADLAGRSVEFALTVLDIKQRDLPEIDDDLAQEEGDYETLAELKEKLADDLFKQASSQAKEELLEAVIDDMLEMAVLKYPPAAIDRELDTMLENFKQQVTMSGWKWEDYLQLEARTEADMREEWQEQAETRLKRGLVLHELLHAEKLTVADSEIEASIEGRLADFDNEDTQKFMRQWLSEGQGRDMIGNELLMDKIYDRIEAIVTGNAPDLDALASEADEEE